MAADLSLHILNTMAVPRTTKPGSRMKTVLVSKDVAHVDRCGNMNGGGISGGPNDVAEQKASRCYPHTVVHVEREMTRTFTKTNLEGKGGAKTVCNLNNLVNTRERLPRFTGVFERNVLSSLPRLYAFLEKNKSSGSRKVA